MKNSDEAGRTLLIRSPNWLGDGVMAAAAVQRLREVYEPPTHRIVVATPPGLSDLWRLHPAVDQTIVLDPKASTWTTAARFKPFQSAVGLLFTNSFRTAFEFWWARLSIRIGYRGQGRSFLLTHPIPLPQDLRPPKKPSPRALQRAAADPSHGWPVQRSFPRHHVYFYLHLISHLGATTDPTPPQWNLEPERIQQTVKTLKLPNPEEDPFPWIALHPGAHYGNAKQWIPGRFIEAARMVHRQRPCRWLILGGPNEVNLTRWLATELGQKLVVRPDRPGAVTTSESVVHLGGKTSLAQLAALLRCCRAFVGNDSGPMHLAASLGTPVVAIFGSTAPEWTGPQWVGSSIYRVLTGIAPCRPCFLRTCPLQLQCMRSIEVEDVAEAILDVLSRSNPSW